MAKAIIDLEVAAAVDDKPGLWGFAFRWLLLDSNKRVTLTAKERQCLLNDMEERLKRVSSKPYEAEKAVSLLAEYYAKEKDETNLLRVLRTLEAAFKADISEEADPLVTINNYQRMEEIYETYAKREFVAATVEKQRIVREMGQLELKWERTMQKLATTITIPHEEIDNYLSEFFGKEDDLETVLKKIAVWQLPRQEAIKVQLEELSNKHPLVFRITEQVIAADGIPLARLESLERDHQKHFKRRAANYLQFGGAFLVFTADELRQRFQKEAVIEYFRKASLFEKEDNEYLERAIAAYWEGDYLVASHLFIPIIESAVRELVKGGNGKWLIVNDLGGYDRVPLSKLLYDIALEEIIREIFAPMGDDILFYLRLVLTEKLGMNLRNDFAHGVGKKKFFEQNTSNRLFHILIWLSLIGVK